MLSGAAGGLIVAGALWAGGRIHAPMPGTGVQVRLEPGALLTVPPAVRVYERVAPSVVLVTNRSERATPLGLQPGMGFGSGVVFDRRGYIVTNEHVVAGARALTVTLADGATYPATFVGADPSTDLAVLRVDAGSLPPVVFSDGPVRPGETAIAIGNPLGPQLTQSVTVGVVSAVRPMLYGLDDAEPRVTRMIQTDVAINPGNSGGPLLNEAGQVIGITTIKVPLVTPGVAASGLGFAIPAGTVQRVVDDLVRFGYVKRAWLGVRLLASPADALAGQPQRITVAAVVTGSPAARAGVRPGDVLLAWNGRAIKGYYGLVVTIDAARPGSAVELALRRDGRTMMIRVVLGAVPHPSEVGPGALVGPPNPTTGGVR